MNNSYDALVIGAGIYGITAAIELRERGHRVGVIDPGPLPHPLAASTDISKVVRMEYGADVDYMQMVDEAIDGWHALNEQFGDTLYHETGVSMLTRQPMAPGGYQYESYHTLKAHGHAVERLDAAAIRERFPAWNADCYVDGFFSARGGYAESGRTVETLIGHARSLGVNVHAGQTADEIVQENGRATAVKTREGETFAAGEIIVCAGSWTPYLVPELQPYMKATGHPIFHLKPRDPDLFTPPNFVVFTADVSRTGWYGFPLHPRAGVVKIANHGAGVTLHPERAERAVYESDVSHLRTMLADTFPALLDAELVYTRRCLYNDTIDEHFWIDRHPEVAGLTLGAGGSGHGFKMGPILGEMIADAVEGKANRWLPKFRWRETAGAMAGEASRYHGEA